MQKHSALVIIGLDTNARIAEQRRKCGTGEALQAEDENVRQWRETAEFHLVLATTLKYKPRFGCSTWRNPERGFSQVDHIRVSRKWANTVVSSKSVWCTPLYSDHAPVTLKGSCALDKEPLRTDDAVSRKFARAVESKVDPGGSVL